MDLLKILCKYPDQDTRQEALKAFSRHLWYLSEDLISLAIFDERVPEEKEQEMLANLTKPGSENQLKRLEGK